MSPCVYCIGYDKRIKTEFPLFRSLYKAMKLIIEIIFLVKTDEVCEVLSVKYTGKFDLGSGGSEEFVF